ncbi:multifunctional acyl-CoA thioesterase I/protease I/lysophospholipase L1 [Photobacterium proteolyticum]|uniref:Multifunctional acyl-CoA thioesterase I/protease I/lysophospholipase L1 n=2 Tax=Photobacterium TaxID=657 RepID=A0A1Q9GTH8_9GAMM|nr:MULTISPECIES: multifunctional acyl-CoA thioesterase I/protease I/lysophospholipase L1 [Photobacterium]NBI53937.1 arylesterase [Photobacterium alginatilyticum]OLQ78359.1 multifunctional acyl-CoA thioesterase I/protease I/lysophospholipase L1 [Photobacterium proteolyticum]
MMRFLSVLLFVVFSLNAYSNTLLVVGDSLSAGYQMRAEQSWPVLMEPVLAQQGHSINVVNASISGDTTGNGLARLPNLLQQHNPDYVIIELGANDGLRGFSPSTIRNNLGQMITRIHDEGATALLMQIHVPPNYGKRYSEIFSKIYPQLSKQYNAPLLPFFLEKIILKQDWMMEDGLHPKPDAQPWIAQFVASELTPYLH